MKLRERIHQTMRYLVVSSALVLPGALAMTSSAESVEHAPVSKAEIRTCDHLEPTGDFLKD